MKNLLLGGAAAIALSAFAVPAFAAQATTAGAATAVVPDNILRKKWTGPYDGVPPWDQGTPALFGPAFQFGIDEMLQEVRRCLRDRATAKEPAARETVANEPT